MLHYLTVDIGPKLDSNDYSVPKLNITVRSSNVSKTRLDKPSSSSSANRINRFQLHKCIKKKKCLAEMAQAMTIKGRKRNKNKGNLFTNILTDENIKRNSTIIQEQSTNNTKSKTKSSSRKYKNIHYIGLKQIFKTS